MGRLCSPTQNPGIQSSSDSYLELSELAGTGTLARKLSRCIEFKLREITSIWVNDEVGFVLGQGFCKNRLAF